MSIESRLAKVERAIRDRERASCPASTPVSTAELLDMTLAVLHSGGDEQRERVAMILQPQESD